MAFHWVENVNTASFTPREYQVELIDAARDRNIIMCLSQSSARDFIALKIIQELSSELRGDPGHESKKSVYLVDDVRVERVAAMLKCLTDLEVCHVKSSNDWDNLPKTVQVLITTADNYANALSCNFLNFSEVNVLIVENCHNVVKEHHDLKQLMDYVRDDYCKNSQARIIAMMGPLYSSNCFGGLLTATVLNIEESMVCSVETASDIVSSLRYSTQPTQLLIECDISICNDLDLELRKQVDIVRQFLEDHRFAPYEIYDEEYIDELNAMSDPKEEPKRILDQFISVLDEFGAWCADKAAYNCLVYLQKQKLKTPYERHYLLLSIVETLLVKIRAICDYELSKYPEIERITKYSTPKVFRLMDIIKSFKPESSISQFEENMKTIDECNFISLSEKLASKCEELSLADSKENNIVDEITKSNLKNSGITDASKLDCSTVCSEDLKHDLSLDNTLIVDRISTAETINNSPKHKNKKHDGQNLRKNRLSRRNANTVFRGARSNYGHYQLDPDALCGIILVHQKFTAKILFALLCELSRHDNDFAFLNVQFTVEKSADPILEPKEADVESRIQEDVLRRFRMHECNLLIGTAILEYGIDMPRCNLVLHWDEPISFSSFAHSKGRARAAGALHAFLVTSPNTELAICKLAEYCEVEQMLLSKCHNMEPPETDEQYADLFTDCIKSYQPLPHVENSPSVNLLSAIALVNRYCAKLPSDTFTRLTPLWRLYELQRNNKTMYQCIVRLPINSPVKKDIIGCPVPSKILARRIAAFQTCVELHKSGELDDNLQPLGKECLKVQEELHLFDFHDEDTLSADPLEPRPGTTKRRQYYFKKIAEALCDCKPILHEPCHLYEICMQLTCPLPDEHNTRGRQIFDPKDSPNGFGLLTRKFIPKIGSFPIFTRSGEVSVSIKLVKTSIVITQDRMEMIYKFINYTFTKVLKLQKLFMLFDPDISNHSYFVVPTIKVNDTTHVDWKFLEIIYLEEISKQSQFNSETNEGNLVYIHREQSEEYIFEAEKFRDAVVMPWYRNQDTPQYFYVAEICKDLNPLSPFPGSNFKCFEHYYNTKYNIVVKNLSQPLLDVDHTSGRLNFLTPRYVNRKGVALPTSSEETKRAKREDLSNKQILIPELCTVHAFPGALWRAAVCLPCILYRINGLLVADQIRSEVAKNIGLGTRQLREGLEWPRLDFGWSLAEVYSKSKVKVNSTVVEDSKTSNPELDEINTLEQKNNLHNITELINNSEDEEIIQDTKLNKHLDEDDSVLEIGLWTNDMAQFNCKDSNITILEGVRYGSPTQWDANDKHIYHDSSEMYSDSDCDGSFDNYSFDDESEESENDKGGLHIEFQSDTQAEAIENDLTKPLIPLFLMQDNDNVELDWKICNIDPEKTSHFVKQYNDRIETIKLDIIRNGILIRSDSDLPPRKISSKIQVLHSQDTNLQLQSEMIPYLFAKGLEKQLSIEEFVELNTSYLNKYGNDSKKLINAADHYEGIDMKIVFEKLKHNKFKREVKIIENEFKFSFDYQPDLKNHPGPSPSLILQALTMSNANDGINLERLETIGDSFLKYAITTYLYCTYDNIHEGKLSHLRSLQVSNLHLYRLGFKKSLGESMIATKFEPHDNWLPPCFHVPKDLEEVLMDANIPASLWDMVNVPLTLSLPRDELVKQVRSRAIELGLLIESVDDKGEETETKRVLTEAECGPGGGIPYNLITQHSIPDKSIADCVEALIGAYLIECGPRGALLFMSWLGIKVLPIYEKSCSEQEAKEALDENCDQNTGYLRPFQRDGQWIQPYYGSIEVPPSPLLREVAYPEECLESLLIGYDALEAHLGYKFRDRSYLLQAMTHASYSPNRLTDCYQRLEFLGDAVLDYLITRHLYDAPQKHSPGALTDLRSALVNNIIFASLAVRHGFHRYFLHRSPGLHEVISRFVAVQEANGHAITEEYYLMEEDECEAMEDVEIPKALGDLFESVAGAIFLDSGMSLDAVWRVYYCMMHNELTQFGNSVPKSPIRELLEMEPETAKFGKPEKLADGRRVRVTVEVFGKGTFKGIGRNYRIAKCTAAKCALKKLKARNKHS